MIWVRLLAPALALAAAAPAIAGAQGLVIERLEPEGPGVEGSAPASAPAARADEGTKLGREKWKVRTPPATPAPAARSPAPGAYPARTEISGGFTTRPSVDTRWEPQEHVAALADRLELGLTHRASERLRLKVAGRLTHDVTARKPTRAHPLGRHRKALFEVEPREVLADVYLGDLDLRLGNQVFAFSANPGFSPAELLNPVDLRHELPALDPEAAKIPVPGIRALAALTGELELTVVYVPLVVPSRLLVTDGDLAIAQPGSPLQLPDPTSVLSPSVQERFEEGVLLTRQPKAYLVNGDAALSLLWRTPAGLDLRLTHTEAWDKAPRLEFDPQLQRVLAALANGATAAAVQADALGLAQRVQAGEGDELVESRLVRTRVTALAATALAGPAQLDLDVAFSPKRTLYVIERTPAGDAFRASERRSLSAALGVSDARGGALLGQAMIFADAVFGVGADEQVFLREPEDHPAVRRTVITPALAGALGWRLADDELLVLLGGYVGLDRLDFVAAPRASWTVADGLQLAAGAELVDGPAGSPGGYFSRNDRVYLELEALF